MLKQQRACAVSVVNGESANLVLAKSKAHCIVRQHHSKMKEIPVLIDHWNHETNSLAVHFCKIRLPGVCTWVEKMGWLSNV